MNLRIHIQRKLSILLCLIILLLSVQVEPKEKVIPFSSTISALDQNRNEIEENIIRANDTLLFRSDFFQLGSNKDEEDGNVLETTNSSNSNNQDHSIRGANNFSENSSNGNTQQEGNDLCFTTGFLESLMMIFLSEFGDRTFMILILYTMKHDFISVIIPASVTMMSLHCMSVGVGSIFPLLFDRTYIVYLAIILFFVFGIKMMHEAYTMKSDEFAALKEELSQIEEEQSQEFEQINGSKIELLIPPQTDNYNQNHNHPQINIDLENQEVDMQILQSEKQSNKKIKPKVAFIHLASLLFLADWGDRCQIAAIALTATRNVWGVLAGGALGMGCCVILSVLFGLFLDGKISAKKTTYIGGILFFFFALESLYSAVS